MSGIVDLNVLFCEDLSGHCIVCEKRAVFASVVQRNPWVWGVGRCVACDDCARRGGIQGIIP